MTKHKWIKREPGEFDEDVHSCEQCGLKRISLGLYVRYELSAKIITPFDGSEPACPPEGSTVSFFDAGMEATDAH